MLAKQISVFLENKPGQLANFIQMLADHHIDLQALSLAEAQEYGLVRIVVDKPEDTVALLKEQNWPCALTEVLSVLVPDKPGSLTEILRVLAQNGINVAYSYAFLTRVQGHACIILRVEDNERATALLTAAGVND